MAKVDTKTFAGGSIPAWALGAYQSTSRDYADIVKSITDAYDKQQARQLQQSRLDQQQEQYEETLEYNRQQDSLNREFQQKKFLYEKEKDNQRAKIEEEQRDIERDYQDYLFWQDNNKAITEGLNTSLDGFEAIDSILNSTSTVGNKYIRDAVTTQKAINNRNRTNFKNVNSNLRDVLFPGLSDEELSETGNDKLLLQYTGEYLKGGKTAQGIKEIMMSRTFDEMNPDVIQRNKSLYNRIDAAYDGLLMAIDPSAREFYQNEISNLESQLNTKIRASSSLDNPQLARIEENPEVRAQFANSRNMSIEEVEEEIKNGSITNADISDFLAGRKEEASGLIEGIGEFLEGTGIPTIGRYLAREDTSLIEDVKEGIEGVPTVVNYLARTELSGLPEKAQNIYSKFAEENPTMAIGVKSAVGAFAPILVPVAGTLALASSTPEERAQIADATLEQLGKAGDMAKDFAYLAIEKADPAIQKMVDVANDKFSQGIEAISEARGAKLGLLRGMQVLSTVPHRALEAFNFQRNPDIKKYIEQGMNPDDAIDQAYKDAVSRGGTYFTTSFVRVGEGAPPEFLYKKQLVDYSKGWYKDGKLPENMAKAPSKFKNPRYIAWKTNELEKDIYQQFANITDSKTQDVSTAGKTMGGVKNEAKRIVKELRKLKSDISKSPSIAKGVSSVSPKVINELINRAQKLTASKSAQKVWSEFTKGAEFNFDFEKEMGASAEKMAEEIEFENLLDSLRQAPTNF